MPLPGGPTDKLGDRYETWWTVSELIRMLHGGSEAIRIEEPGFDKAEFVVTVGGTREWHQAKRSHPSGKWSLAALGGADVQLLQAVNQRLATDDDRFIFVSSSDARELAELSERARQAAGPEEFGAIFLAAREQAKRLDRLRRCWGDCDLSTAYDRLRRIEVRTVDEPGIEQTVRWGVRALFLADPSTLVAELRTIVQDSIHQTITRDGLIDRLARRGFIMRRLARPDSAAALVSEATRRYLNGARRKLIRHTLLPRAETQSLFQMLGSSGSDLVLTGRAGCGKTGCVIEFVEALQLRGIPVLAFRLDSIDPVSSALELGQALGLEESPVLVLAAAAEGREAVLVIDQLDAISTMSGRATVFLDAIEGLLTEARGLRARVNLHLLVACREFDWEHDHRLKQLLTGGHARVSVGGFLPDQVKQLLSDAGFGPSRFESRQLDLLRLPQNLSLFLDVGFDPARVPAFNTAAELFSRYWDAKRDAVRQRFGSSPDLWMDVIGILTEEMTRTQQLSVPREELDRVSSDYLAQMASEGVLAFDGRRYGFGHESFFDYCFARTFLTKDESLVTLLTEAEQHLFRRAQVRQVLTYLRDADRMRYTQELEQLLSEPRVRVHVKDLVLALLANVPDPGDDEWTIWQRRLQPTLAAIEAGVLSADRLSGLAWRHFFSSRSWFDFVCRTGLVGSWLASGSDGLEDVAVAYLRFHQRHSPDYVAELLEPYAETGGKWTPRLRSVVAWADHTDSRRFFDLILRLIGNGTLDDARAPIASNSTYWLMFHDLGTRRPEWIPEVIAHWLRRRLAVLHATGADLGGTGIFGHDQFGEEPIADAASRAPLAFVEHVLPVILEISDLAVHPDLTPPRRDRVWPGLIKGARFGLDGACLAALNQALAALARDATRDLGAVIERLRSRDTYIANHLLLSLYTAGAARYAHEAVELLCTEPWRFECGFIDSSHWTATELVRAVVPFCTLEGRRRLEAAILAYASPYERTVGGYRQSGWACFALLSAFPSELRSAQGNVRFRELERKFGKPEEPPRGIVVGFVGSPIGKNATDKMTDDQWLRAIAKYHSEQPTRVTGGELKGGAWELAQTLEALVQEQPERFARLSLRFPTDVNPVYMSRTLAGLRRAVVASDLKLEVCRKAYADCREACGQAIVDLLGTFEDALPEDASQMIDWLATEHPDPEKEAWQEDVGGGQFYYDGDIYTNGINTTRGRAAEAIRDLVWRDAAYVGRFQGTLDRMIRDRSTCVCACVVGTLRAVAHHDTSLALKLFSQMDLTDDRLLATTHAYHLIRRGLRDHFDDLRPFVERMLRSDDSGVAQTGARLAGIAALYHRRAADLEREALAGTRNQRLGVAEVATANVADIDSRAWCEQRLRLFFNDEDEEVRREAASCFRHLQDESLESYEDLILAFCDSTAYGDGSFSILNLLANSAQRLPGIACVVCEKFLERFGGDARDMQTRAAADAYTVTQLVFRTYHQHQDDAWTSRALDLIDRLCLEGVGDARKELEAFER